jgi:hypothetical protein
MYRFSSTENILTRFCPVCTTSVLMAWASDIELVMGLFGLVEFPRKFQRDLFVRGQIPLQPVTVLESELLVRSFVSVNDRSPNLIRALASFGHRSPLSRSEFHLKVTGLTTSGLTE